MKARRLRIKKSSFIQGGKMEIYFFKRSSSSYWKPALQNLKNTIIIKSGKTSISLSIKKKLQPTKRLLR